MCHDNTEQNSQGLMGNPVTAGRPSVGSADAAAAQKEAAQVQQPGRSADGGSAPGGQAQRPARRPGSLRQGQACRQATRNLHLLWVLLHAALPQVYVIAC